MVPGSDIVFSQLKLIFIDWSDVEVRLDSIKNFDDLNARKILSQSSESKLNILPSASKVLVLVPAA